MKALITGVNGFVGRYLEKELQNNQYDVVGTDVIGDNVYKIDLLDYENLVQLIEQHEPDVIFHLAGQSSVGYSWKNPKYTVELNVCGTINLLNAVHAGTKKARVIIIGSSDQYGVIRLEDNPVKEDQPQNPGSPYAISKYSQELIALSLSKAYGLDVILTRSFNHIGAGQKTGFVVSDFSSAIVDIEKGRNEPILMVGNLDAKRDFSDVRDVVCAYRLLAEKGISGEVYNVGSGVAISIQELLTTLLALSPAKITVKQDPAKLRPSDVPIVCCDNQKLVRQTGWKPTCKIEDTLQEILEYYRNLSVE